MPEICDQTGFWLSTVMIAFLQTDDSELVTEMPEIFQQYRAKLHFSINI
jgi:hypothetical protein